MEVALMVSLLATLTSLLPRPSVPRRTARAAAILEATLSLPALLLTERAFAAATGRARQSASPEDGMQSQTFSMTSGQLRAPSSQVPRRGAATSVEGRT